MTTVDYNRIAQALHAAHAGQDASDEGDYARACDEFATAILALTETLSETLGALHENSISVDGYVPFHDLLD